MSPDAVSTPVPLPSPTSAPMSARIHLGYLDGIRGLAALYVALYHAAIFAGHYGAARAEHGEAYSTLGKALQFLTSFGHYGVAVFIVLSGFCLAIPVARDAGLNLRGGMGEYLKRRARRILPPYYAALLLSILLITAVPLMQQPMGTAWDSKIPVTVGTVATHLALVHNLIPDHALRINGPMWSVASEWQIYFVFPLLLLPIWKRFGAAWSALAGLVLGMLLWAALPGPMSRAHPWYIGLFGFGIVAAHLAFRSNRRIPTGPAFASLAIVTLLCLLARREWMSSHPYLSETLVGLATAAGILHGVQILRRENGTGKQGPLFRAVNSRAAVHLGGFSYSIYLVHSPLLALFNLVTLGIPLSADARLMLMVFVAVPVAVTISYGFYRLFERPLIRTT